MTIQFSHTYRQARISNFKVLIAVLIFLMVSGVLIANSQTAPEFLITWKASPYVPSDYQGKILPTRESVINISFDVIDSGKIADLSRNEIRWKSGGKIINSGIGSKNSSFVISKIAVDELRINITILNSKGRDLNKSISIPIADPEVVIQQIGPASFEAKPYFFNINNVSLLNFDWTANGEKPAGSPKNPNIVTIENLTETIKTSLGIKLNLGVKATNILNPIENAVGKLIINI